MPVNQVTRATDIIYYQQLRQLIYKSDLSFPEGKAFEWPTFLMRWEWNQVFKPMERSFNQFPDKWPATDYPVMGYKNDEWMKKHLELLIEANYEHELNGVFYEFSVHGEHVINRIETMQPHKYFYRIEKILALYERKIFGNNSIQNSVYAKYEQALTDKIKLRYE